MRLYNRYAEKFLLEKARSMATEQNRWRCIYINFSSHKDQCSDGLRTNVVTNILKELLDEEEGYIYLCEDGDVFIIFQGKVMDIINRLGEHFHDLADPTNAGQGEDAFYRVFDLGLKWNEFFALCEKKHAQITPEEIPAPPARMVPAFKPLRDMDSKLFSAANARRADRKRLSVLIVEDDPFTRRLVTNTLKADYDIIEAADGAAALKAYETGAPDAVFLDIELPDTNGHAILSKLLSFDKSAFVVMLSANSVKENILGALEKGAQGFTTKPFAREKLTHYLRLCETARRGGHPVHTGALHV